MARISGQLEMTVNKKDIELLATKTDINIINDRITAQAEDIKQIRDEMGQYKKKINNLRDNMDRGEATKLNRMYRQLGQPNVNNNMSDQTRFQTPRPASTQKNIVVEGLNGDTESDIVAEFLNLTAELNVIVYKTDVEDIFRMKRRDVNATTPGPVLIKLSRVSVRDSIMKKRLISGIVRRETRFI